jgi:hypothetical protein
MSAMETAQLLGNYGEFVGAIAVVLTLFYLTVQIRQSSRSMRSSAAQAVLHAISEQYRVAAESQNLAHVVGLGVTDFEKLDSVQRTQFLFWLFSWFRLMEQAHQHFKSGNIPESTWKGQLAHLKSYLSTPAAVRFWELRSAFFSEEFQSLVSSISTEESTVADATEGLTRFRMD